MGATGSGRPLMNDPWVPDPDKPLWFRQTDEINKSWYAFTTYRDMGLLRTYEKTAAKLKKPPGYAVQLGQWGRKWGWRERCLAWDNRLDSIVLSRQEMAIARVKDEHLELVGLMKSVAKKELEKLKVFVSQMDDVPCMSPKDLQCYVDSIVKLDRLIHGEAGTIVEAKHEVSVDTRNELLPALRDPEALELIKALVDKIGQDESDE